MLPMFWNCFEPS